MAYQVDRLVVAEFDQPRDQQVPDSVVFRVSVHQDGCTPGRGGYRSVWSSASLLVDQLPLDNSRADALPVAG
jgi:hypothetical protein